MTDKRRGTAAFLLGLGASLLIGGLFGAGLMVVLPVQVGLAAAWPGAMLADPVFYVFAGLALVFLIMAIAGAAILARAVSALKKPDGPAA